VGQTGLDVPYSAEYVTTGTNATVIRSLAQAGGGSVITQPRSVWQDNLPSVLARRSLAPWLAFLALVLLPIDVGIRRLTLGRRDLEDIKAGLPGRSREARNEQPSTVLLGAVRTIRMGVSARSMSGERGKYASASARRAQDAIGSARGGESVGATTRRAVEAPSSAAAKVPAPAALVEETTTSKLLAARRKRR